MVYSTQWRLGYVVLYLMDNVFHIVEVEYVGPYLMDGVIHAVEAMILLAISNS